MRAKTGANSYLALLVLLGLLAGMGWLTLSEHLEPTETLYRGRSAVEWEADLGNVDPGIRVQAAWALGHFGTTAMSILVRALRDPSSGVRQAAAWAIGATGRVANASVPALVQILQDGDPEVRRHAAWALGRIGPPARDTAPALVRTLADADIEVRKRAAWALSQIGPAAVPLVVEALGDRDAAVRQAAVWTLMMTGRRARDALPVLRGLAEGEPGLEAELREVLRTIEGR